jgi:hypothetical protein
MFNGFVDPHFPRRCQLHSYELLQEPQQKIIDNNQSPVWAELACDDAWVDIFDLIHDSFFFGESRRYYASGDLRNPLQVRNRIEGSRWSQPKRGVDAS